MIRTVRLTNGVVGILAFIQRHLMPHADTRTSVPREQSGFASIGLIARHCVATLAFHHFCQRSGIAHPLITQFVDHMWTLPTSREWGDWERALVATEFGGFATGDSIPSELAPVLTEAGVGESAFRRLAEATVEVVLCSFYAAVNDSDSLRYLETVIDVAATAGYSPPESAVFSECRFADYHGWGHAPSAETLSLWKSYEHQ